MPTLDQITTGQSQKETTINQLLEAVGMGGEFGVRRSTTTGLTLGLYGGRLNFDGSAIAISNATSLQADNNTNYVFLTRSGGSVVFSVNNTGFPAGCIPLYQVTTSGGVITAVTDQRRPMKFSGSRLSLAVTTTDVTLTYDQSTAETYVTTGTLTGNRNLIVPAVPRVFLVYNTCGGAFTLTVKTPSGSGVIVPAQRRIWLACDGTNVMTAIIPDYQDIAYAASITPDLSAGRTIVVGALTGNLTINAPTSVVKGERITFTFVQDATGGRTITWNAVFKKAADGAGTANQVAATQFLCYDGTNFIQIGGAMSWIT